MNFQILPNKFKSVGLTLFFICLVLPMFLVFFEALTHPFVSNENLSFSERMFSQASSKWLEFISLLGMLFYMLSKEKVEDDYINKLRLESFQMTTLIGLIAGFITYFFDDRFELSMSYFIFLFLLTFLIIFSIKKRANQ